jgi:hypothetical protein
MKSTTASYLIILSFALLVACETPQPTATSYMGPDGKSISKIKCNDVPDGCFNKASEVCGGKYLVLDSFSYSGGMYTDASGPGPVTWYTMNVKCGVADGKMPQFPFRGEKYDPNLNAYQPPPHKQFHNIEASDANQQPQKSQRFETPKFDMDKRTDFTCMEKCTQAGSSHQFCVSKCSY